MRKPNTVTCCLNWHQFPTLGFVVERYWEIQAHQPEDFWTINCQYSSEEGNANFSWKWVSLSHNIWNILYLVANDTFFFVTQTRASVWSFSCSSDLRNVHWWTHSHGKYPLWRNWAYEVSTEFETLEAASLSETVQPTNCSVTPFRSMRLQEEKPGSSHLTLWIQ